MHRAKVEDACHYILEVDDVLGRADLLHQGLTISNNYAIQDILILRDELTGLARKELAPVDLKHSWTIAAIGTLLATADRLLVRRFIADREEPQGDDRAPAKQFESDTASL